MDFELKQRLMNAAVSHKFDDELCRDVYNSYKVLRQHGGVEEWMKLRQIGGCKKYHQEGDALTHTMMVYVEALNYFDYYDSMSIVALLHDVGKIYTGVQNAEGDWSYPYHSVKGAEKLSNFLPEEYYLYANAEWLIRNHIKPLFWQKDGVNTTGPEDKQTAFNHVRLAILAVCDINGSISEEPQTELLNYLQSYIQDHVQR